MTRQLDGLDPAELQQEARNVYRQSVAAEMPPTGKSLGAMFDRSERWGRDRIAEVKRTDGLAGPAQAPPEQRSTSADARQEPTAEDNPDAGEARQAETAADEPPTDDAAASGPEAAATTQAAPKPTGRDLVHKTTAAAVAIVAAVAAVISYLHVQEVAWQAGEGWRSWLLPCSVDGLLVAAGLSMFKRRQRGQKTSAVAVLSMVLGIAASLAANVAAAGPTLEGKLVSVWPPLALALAFELLLQMRE